MNKDYTDITVVVDRSGSMAGCKEEAQNGLNRFVEEQKKHPGKATYSLVQFDDVYEFVHRGIPIAEAPAFVLEPRGWTALLDAVGVAIAETGQRLAAMPEPDRPGLVVFVIVTDGHENHSREYTVDRVRAMIEEQTTKYGWQFTFLGADLKAVQDAVKMGISAQAVGVYDAQKCSGKVYRAAANNVTRMRSARAGGQSVSNFYTDEEKADMGGNK